MRRPDSNEDAAASGARIKGARVDKGLSVAKLAELAQVSKAYMHQIENGECFRPSAQILYDIAQSLGTSVAYLLGRASKGPEPEATPIPQSLREFANSEPDLTQEDIEMLARIRHRQNQPESASDWRYLWESIKRSVKER